MYLGRQRYSKNGTNLRATEEYPTTEAKLSGLTTKKTSMTATPEKR